jgi:signal transduction histidine kinase
MTEEKDIAKRISEIFNSNLPIKLKYDKTSELLANIFNARSVTFLLYESKIDALLCQGYYLNIDGLNIANSNLKGVLSNINIYDFLKHRKVIDSECNTLYKEFQKNNNLFKEIDENIFSHICTHFNENLKEYEQYKKIIKEEIYEINNSTITGNYFLDLLKFDKIYNSKVVIEDLSNFEEEKKKCITLLQDKLNISIESDGYYLGLPLYATERYFGIVRIIFPKKQTFLNKKGNGFELDKEYAERFNYLSQIISLHLETNYYLDGYKKLSNLNESIQDLKSLNNLCELICEILNCNGSLIRYSEEETDEILIKGYSKSLNKYVEKLKSFHDQEIPEVRNFSKSLVELFQNDASIVAANFNTEIDKPINIFRTDENGEIKSGEQKLQLIELQSKPYLNLLKDLNIEQLSVVTIPNIKNGYMTFTNTQNRKFITADIEMLILAVKGIGLEIKHKQDTKIINQQQVEIAQTESMRNVVHQLGAPLQGIMGHLYNIVNKKVPEEIVNDKMFYTYHMIKNSMRQLKRFQRILELDTKPILSKNLKIISIPKYLINKSMEFQAITKSKGITIHVYSEDDLSDYFFPLDEELFEEVISILIDNAAKYSFNSRELSKNSIKYDETERKSAGNILISFKEIGDDLRISISNWGAIIQENENEKVFDKHYRGINANKFSPIGSGIGLYLAKKIVHAMNSKITLASTQNKTTFIITLKRKK